MERWHLKNQLKTQSIKGMSKLLLKKECCCSFFQPTNSSTPFDQSAVRRLISRLNVLIQKLTVILLTIQSILPLTLMISHHVSHSTPTAPPNDPRKWPSARVTHTRLRDIFNRRRQRCVKESDFLHTAERKLARVIMNGWRLKCPRLFYDVSSGSYIFCLQWQTCGAAQSLLQRGTVKDKRTGKPVLYLFFGLGSILKMLNIYLLM